MYTLLLKYMFTAYRCLIPVAEILPTRKVYGEPLDYELGIIYNCIILVRSGCHSTLPGNALGKKNVWLHASIPQAVLTEWYFIVILLHLFQYGTEK